MTAAGVAFGVSVLLVAWLAAGSMAVRSASRIWLRHWAEQRLRGASSVMLYLERPQRLLAAGNAGIALTLGLAGLWIGWGAQSTPSNRGVVWIALIGYVVIVIIFGHMLPRAIARRWPSALIPISTPILRAAEIVTSPLLSLGRAIARVDDSSSRDEPAHEAMQDLLREGELEGVGKREEIAIINGVMEFGETKVRDVMTPRQDIFAIAAGNPDAQAVAAQIADSAFSRVPVYEGTLDNVVGMYHAFDVLKERAERLPPLRPVARASADTPCNELLFRMLRARLHLAVVHDDAGVTLGIATLENLLEELVGDIRDEHDEPAVAASAVPAAVSAPKTSKSAAS
jgi:putative hemolysin